jgi:hypothetical protein
MVDISWSKIHGGHAAVVLYPRKNAGNQPVCGEDYPLDFRVAQRGQGVLVGHPHGVKDFTHLLPLQRGQRLSRFNLVP